MEKGRVYLVPSFLSETNSKNNFPLVNNELIYSLNIFIVENLRTARRFLRKIGYKKDFGEVKFYELNKHTDSTEINNFLDPALKGENIGLISEAGTPCVADPGSEIVLLAHRLSIDIIPSIQGSFPESRGPPVHRAHPLWPGYLLQLFSSSAQAMAEIPQQ